MKTKKRKRIAIIGACLICSSSSGIKENKYTRQHKEAKQYNVNAKPSIRNIDNLFKN